MGLSEAETKNHSSMAATNVDATAPGSVTVWDHARTFALVGVSSQLLQILVSRWMSTDNAS